MCPGFLPPVLPTVSRKEDLAWGALSRVGSYPGEQCRLSVVSALCPAAAPAGFCAVLSSDCLCASLLCCSPFSYSAFCNSLRATSLAFTAVWLGLPSSSFPEKPQCAQEDAGASGAMRSSGEASGVGREPLSHPDLEPESTPPPFLLLPQPAPALGLGRGEAG